MFSKQTFVFLRKLQDNNNRPWFEANRDRYESLVRQPALDFIVRMAPHLATFAPHFVAEAKKTGGSLMRVNRDTRFSRSKEPYKTNIGIQFRHEKGRDIHAPGFYFHVDPDDCFIGAGCWHPEPDVLGRIRDRIARNPDEWLSLRADRTFARLYSLEGGMLTRPPRGYAADHPAADDLKRKDFIGMAPLSSDEVIGPDIVKIASSRFAAAASFMRFLCEALDLEL